ncbi:MAG: acetyl-CoA carboxylase biotin carboxylase subunit [Elusimicrobia bacterium CG08_land_8_20_14_0_20_51_18]|nr:MAG: acetyl-CoA carboxylase biotin carboxylase subunit [Elusimicrobia bacterium CG08_land_8_20_14_0_20_51_18]
MSEFKKVLIANRGEIALRVIRTLREMGIGSVAVYSEGDRNSMHIRMADEAVCIGAAPSRNSYLVMENIISAALSTGCDAVHPGYGFLSENAGFSKLCSRNRLVFIGPSPDSIKLLGHKAQAREIASKAGVPVTPGSDGCIKKDFLKEARKIGYPVMIKAAAGGGGRGIRIVFSEDKLLHEVEMARNEAGAAFGNDEVYFERFIDRPRHIEIQFVRDCKGNIAAFPERDCSVQRRNQKLIEETPSPAVTPELRKKLQKAVYNLADSADYHGAGTVEFLLDKNGSFYFMEVNTRLQVEHPVTESITGTDLVREQILVARKMELSVKQKDADAFKGHSIEHRINAEDWRNNFMPSVGRIDEWIPPGGPGIRIDSHVYTGYNLPVYYDSMIAKLVIWAPTRSAAIARSNRALDEFKVEGIKTTIGVHKKIINSEEFMSGDLDTKFLERFLTPVAADDCKK